MNHSQLKYFVSAAETGNFSKTAERFFISQAAVTMQIQQLEDSLHCTLFDRSKRPLQLTEAGKAFYKDARDILIRIEASIQNLDAIAINSSAHIRIGYVHGLERAQMNRYAEEFHQFRPDLFLMFLRRNMDELIFSLDHGYGDIFFSWKTPQLADSPSLTACQVASVPIQILMRRDHPLAAKESLCLNDLNNESFITYSSGISYFSDKDVLLKQLCEHENIELRVLYRTSEPETAAMMVSVGEGIAFLPRFTNEAPLSSDTLTVRPLVGKGLEQQIVAIWKKDNTSSSLASALEFLRKTFPGFTGSVQ